MLISDRTRFWYCDVELNSTLTEKRWKATPFCGGWKRNRSAAAHSTGRSRSIKLHPTALLNPIVSLFRGFSFTSIALFIDQLLLGGPDFLVAILTLVDWFTSYCRRCSFLINCSFRLNPIASVWIEFWIPSSGVSAYQLSVSVPLISLFNEFSSIKFQKHLFGIWLLKSKKKIIEDSWISDDICYSINSIYWFCLMSQFYCYVSVPLISLFNEFISIKFQKHLFGIWLVKSKKK